MKRTVPLVYRKYFQRLLIGLLAFIFLLYIPFSVITIRTSKQSILNNINVSNQTVLDQLRRNYNAFSENVTSLAASIFWRSDIQQLLYSPRQSYQDIYFTLKDLYTTFVVSHPSLHSIGLYNKYSKEFYIVSATGNVNRAEFLRFVDEQDGLQPLRPVLHEMSLLYNVSTVESQVFSYFMYQFDDPSQGNESFLVLNQYASQSVSTIDTFAGGSYSFPTATYYVTPEDSVANNRLPAQTQQAHEALLDSFRAQKEQLPPEGGCYTDVVDGAKYLVSYIEATPQEDALVIIQDYDLVFADLHLLQRNLTIVTALFFCFALLLVPAISRKLYEPIDGILDYFAQGGDAALSEQMPRRINELSVIKDIYQKTSEQSRRLESRESHYQPIALQYSLASLLLRSDVRGVEQFRKSQPNHWLSSVQEGALQVVLLRPVSKTGNAQTAVEVEMSLLLYAVQNIAEELLEPSFQRSSFKYSSDCLCIIVQPKQGASQQPLVDSLKQACRVMQQHFGISFAAAVSGCGHMLGSLSSLTREAEQCLSYVFLYGPTIITGDTIAPNEHNAQTTYPPELDTRLETAITQQDLAQCNLVLADIKAVLRQFTIGAATICTIVLLNQVRSILSQQSQNAASSAASASFRSVYSCISGTGTIDQCFDAIRRFISTHLSDQTYESETGDELFVSTVFEFVQNSYFDVNLSSQLIADYLGLNNRYLMKKFKTLTGITLAEYIVGFRMKKAAAMLRDTDMAVSTIAEQVGIDNLSYFYRLFKKIYDCTPKEFREASGTISQAQ